MSGEPTLAPANSLHGTRIALSVSESADLARLGLSDLHLDLAIAELCRAIFFAGGIVVYGGSINWGFTSIVLNEAERYGYREGAFEHYLAYSEHADVSMGDLRDYTASLGVKCSVRFLDPDGIPRALEAMRQSAATSRNISASSALTAMRAKTSEVAQARVVVGGKVAGFQGQMPGVAEESVWTLRENKPLYVAGGFGGAAALVGSIFTPELFQWMPADMPRGLEPDVVDAVAAALAMPLSADGLDESERASLAATHRPSEIASLTVLGLSRLANATGGSA